MIIENNPRVKIFIGSARIETIGFKKVFIAARTTATTIAVKKLSIITFGNK